MSLFQRDKQKLEIIKPKKFPNEKELQTLFENNLEEMFNCRFIATEFSTGPIHGTMCQDRCRNEYLLNLK